MSSVEKQNGSLHVFGLGVRVVAQITLEANYLLQQMDRIFHLEDGPETSEYIESINGNEVNLRHLYVEGKPREQVYQDICDTIISSVTSGSKCAFLTPGNPAFLNTIVFKLRASAKEHNIPFSIYAGVSSLDTLIADLFLPVEAVGLQCFDATYFVRVRPQVDKRVPLLLFQPSVVDTFDVHYVTGVYKPGVTILRDVLIEIYGPDEKWLLWRSAMGKDDSPIVSVGTLAELTDKAEHLELGTLLISGHWKYNSME